MADLDEENARVDCQADEGRQADEGDGEHYHGLAALETLVAHATSHGGVGVGSAAAFGIMLYACNVIPSGTNAVIQGSPKTMWYS